ncbi:SDR family oxidoreductase [Ruficoccus amylovorans]|uniref:dTDP-4-dehydrorhamnose reductase n=1 Tax=Ruficoccus amylovorans TaxID=1804625 RepID=A0A842HLU8_9BACT|nr:SDR family oxidoreductase [Ruficoccus amylovorans]MBC2596091.1 SDR family oxidoreductase [Ruficoccus amylovorans]
MKIALTGASGLAGFNTARAARARNHEVHAFYHSRQPELPGLELHQIDLSEPENVVGPLLEIFPDVIIHAAAVSSPADCDADPARAEKLNVALPRRLAQVAHHLGCRLIHLSTDMVFDGQQGTPYRSTDLPIPMGLYGQLKLLAEREVLEHGVDEATVLRIPILTGNSPSGNRSVHEKLFHAWAAGKRPTLYTDEIRQPLSAANLGELLVELCERRNLHGIFHWAGNETVTRYEMGRRILERFGLPEDLIEPVTCDDASRPTDLRFELAPLVGKLKTVPLSYEFQLDEMLVPADCRDWYEQASGRSAAPVRLKKGVDF